MITEERVMELFAEDNPIPSVDDLDLAHLGFPAYLATLEQRSSEVTQLDTRTPKTTHTPNPRTWLIAVAAVVVIAALGALLVLTNNEPDIADSGPESVIDQFFAATDYDSLAETLTEEALDGYMGVSGYLFTETEISEDFVTRQIIGAERSVESCENVGESIVRCQVSDQSHITEAMGQEPRVNDATFYLADGLISADPTLSYSEALFDITGFARANGLEETLTELCPGQNLNPECATFIMDNLADWVAWEQANQ